MEQHNLFEQSQNKPQLSQNAATNSPSHPSCGDGGAALGGASKVVRETTSDAPPAYQHPSPRYCPDCDSNAPGAKIPLGAMESRCLRCKGILKARERAAWVDRPPCFCGGPATIRDGFGVYICHSCAKAQEVI